jgi:hypothetical protein
MAKDFSQDGAWGSDGGGTATDSGPTNSASPSSALTDGDYSYTDKAGVTGFGYDYGGRYFQNQQGAQNYQNDMNMRVGLNFNPAPVSNDFGNYWAQFNAADTNPGRVGASSDASTYGSMFDSAAANQGNHGALFEDGGEVPDGVGDLSELISLALSSVDAGLDFGRKKHGLASGDDQAANMPAIPGNQSESGVARPQPAPGPLPPTSNPFGKRADNDSDDGQGAGAIPDNDEDDTEAA